MLPATVRCDRPGHRSIRARVVPLVVLLLLAGAAALQAGPTDVDRASAAVRGWLALDRTPLGAAMSTEILDATTFRDLKGDPVCHVIRLSPTGLVIVSVNDRIEPIIAFLPGATAFDPSPANPLGALVMGDLAKRAAEARTADAAQAASAPHAQAFVTAKGEKWERLEAAARGAFAPSAAGIGAISDERVAPFVQSRWNQANAGGGLCFNYFTPNNYVSGCVSTAMAQLMRFHRHPLAGVGTASFEIKVGGVAQNRSLMGGDGLGGPYDWTLMDLQLGGTVADSHRRMIGRIIADAGAVVRTDYASGGSSAYMSDAAAALRSVFGYSSSVLANAYSSGWGTFGDARIDVMVNPNLDASLPVLLGIRSPTAGHAIVADGYGYNAGTQYHHLNLGWGGYQDAWYDLPAILDFTVVEQCVYNVYPTGSGEIISGRVVDGQGQPIAGAYVTATRTAGGQYSAQTNERGIFALVKLPAGSTYSVRVQKAGYTFPERTGVATGSSSDPGSANGWAGTCGNVWNVDFTGATGAGIALADALDTPGRVWTAGGYGTWIGQTTTTFDGVDAARAPSLAAGQKSWIETTVTGPVNVRWKGKITSTQPNKLEVSQDNTPKSYITGLQDWRSELMEVPAGSHVLRWTFVKDVATSLGGEGAWLDVAEITAPAPAITSPGADTAFVGGRFTYRIAATNSPTIFGATGLPPGLAVDTSTGLIMGTPTAAGQFSVNLTASNAGGTGQRTLTLEVIAISLAEALDTSGVSWTCSGQGSWFGQSAITWDGADAARSPALGSAQSASLETWLTGPGTVRFRSKVSCAPGAHNLVVRCDGNEVDRLTGEVVWTQRSFEIPAGSHKVSWTYAKDQTAASGLDSAWIDGVEFAPAVPAITSALTASATVGVPFTYQILASGNPSSYGATGLPAGLAVSAATGLVSGTPTSAGTFNLEVSAINPAGTGRAQLVLTVLPAPTTLSDALDTAGWTWTTGGDGSWYSQSGVTADGVDAARSPALGDSRSSWLEATVTGPGTLRFKWRVSSEAGWDILSLSVDGKRLFKTSGIETAFTQRSVNLPEGTHTVRWTYTKDTSATDGLDSAFIDDVSFTGGAALTHGDALDVSGLPWNIGGDGAWYPQQDLAFDGADAVQTSVLGASQSVWIETALTGPGTARFKWKLQAGSADTLKVFVDGSESPGGGLTGQIDWSDRSVSVPQGAHTLRVVFAKGGVWSVPGPDAAWIDRFSFTSPAPAITSSPVATAFVGTPFSYQITATNAPTGYGASGLPAGLSVNTATGLISGTPTQAGQSAVALTATNAGGTGAADLALAVTLTLAEALDTGGWTWTTGGSGAWYGQSSVSSDGADAARSPAVGDGQVAWMESPITGPGVVRFRWRASSQSGCDFLSVSLDQRQLFRVSGDEAAFVQRSVYVPSGAHAVRWAYTKDGSGSSAQDAAFVDQVMFAPGPERLLADALDTPGRSWATGGNGFWFPQENDASDGSSAAQCNVIDNGESAWLDTTFQGPGSLTFKWKCSGKTTDSLSVLRGGTLIDAVAGEQDWSQRTVDLPAGSQTVRWSFAKSGTGVAGRDSAWVDQVVFRPAVPLITSPSFASGTQFVGFAYQVTATNNPGTYGAIGLPSGLSINATSGQITGAPQSAGTFNVSLSANNVGGTGWGALRLTVASASTVSLPEALDTPGRTWTTGGAGAWYGQSVMTADGVDAARSPTIGHGRSTTLETPVLGPAAVTFQWRVSSEPNCDFLSVLVDGTLQARISGATEWAQSSVPIPSGNHTIQWAYSKDGDTSAGSDCGHVDQVTVTPVAPPTITSPLSVRATTGRPFSYRIQATSSPTGFGATGLPGGLGVSSSTGEISGIPTSPGEWVVRITATNAAGAGGADLRIMVLPTVTVSLAEALDTPGWTWTTGGDGVWFGQSAITADGIDAAMSPPLTDGQSAWFETTLAGPGRLAFTFRVSSESSADWVSLHLDGALVDRDSGAIDWNQDVVEIPAGTHTVRCAYSKDAARSAGADAVWIDQVAFTPLAAPVITSAATASGTEGLSFSYGIVATNGPVSYGASGLPAGLVLDVSTGRITGIARASGTYDVTLSATNPAGTGTGPLRITLAAAGDVPLPEALDTPSWTWVTAGDGIWTGQRAVTADGTDAARSPALADGRSASMEARVQGPGSLAFKWRVSSEANFDWAILSIDGVEQARISGNEDWTERAVDIPTSGTHVVRWSYSKDYSVSAGSDAAWIDQVRLSSFLPAITSPTTATAVLGVSFAYQITATSSPTRFGASGLPEALQVDEASGRISGTPLSEGTYPVTLTASNGFGTGTAPLVLTVASSAIISLPEALDTPGWTWTTSGDGVFAGQSGVTSDGIDAAQAPVLGHNRAASLETTISGPTTLTFRWRVSSEANYDFLSFWTDGALVERISGERDWALKSVDLGAGPHTVRWTYSKDVGVVAGSDSAWVDQVWFTANPPTITSPLSAVATRGAVFGYQIAATDSPTSFGATGLPAGLTVNSSTGRISGTPTTFGVYPIGLSATNAAGTGSAVLTLTVGVPLVEALDAAWATWETTGDGPWYGQTTITADSVDAAQSPQLSHSRTATLRLSGAVEGPASLGFRWKVSSETNYDYLTLYLDGVAQESISGSVDWTQRWVEIPGGSHAIWWTYSKDGSVSTGADCGWVDQVALSNQPPPAISSATTAVATLGVPFAYQIAATNNPASFSATGLPGGLAVNTSTGQISGTPRVAGMFLVTVSASNGAGTGSAELRLQVDIGLAEALDTSGWTWTTSGAGAWTGQAAVTSDGVDAAQSPSVGHSQAAAFESTVTGPGMLAFQWAVSSEQNYDWLEVKVDGVRVDRISGSVGWAPKSIAIGSGSHTIGFAYSKDGSVVVGADTAWVDQVVFEPLSVPQITSPAVVGAVLGKVFAYQIVATNAPTSFGAAGLPQGLVVNQSTGLVSGTPSVAGTSSVTLTATNLAGTGTAPLRISVGIPLPDALDTPGATWQTGGDLVWTGQTAVSFDGVDAAETPALTDGQSSWMELRVAGPGEIAFRWKVSSETDYDWLSVSLDGVLKARISGESGWAERTVSVPPGEHVVRFAYVKDSSRSGGADRAWVDRVRLPGEIEIVSPVSGSTLVGSAVTVQWTGGAAEYWLYAGGSAGDRSFYNSGSLGAATSAAVTGLPIDGSTIHVRLWYRLAGAAWLYRDASYTAARISYEPVMDPARGSTLAGPEVTFRWNSGAAEYWLYFGSSRGLADLLDSGSLGTGTSRAVTGLPTNGSAVHVRLWYRLAGTGSWLYADHAYTAATLSYQPAMASPEPGSTLPGSTVTFQWNGGATAYWLYVGTAPGLADIHDSGSLATSTSRTVTRIPGAGSPVHVRLFYRLGTAAWEHADFSYTSFSYQPTMLSPTAGSTLTASAVDFQWNAGATEYWLCAGTAVGSSDLHSSGSLGSATSTSVSGLPVNGSTVHVRLWYRLTGASAWLSRDYSYTAAASDYRPAMESPAPGSTLTGPTQTFRWNVGAARYWLYVGTAAGLADIHDSGDLGTSTARDVSRIPGTGSTIHVRLFYRRGQTSGWERMDFTYRSFTYQPAMLNPAPGSTLAGSSVVFQWTGGASDYWLYVGRAAGSNSLHDSGNLGSGTSRTVGNLPTDGSAIHVRLWYRLNPAGIWQSRDFAYVAQSEPCAPPYDAFVSGHDHAHCPAGIDATRDVLPVGHTRGGEFKTLRPGADDRNVWRFAAVAGHEYEARTSHLSDGCDTLLSVSDGGVELASNDDGGSGKASIVRWVAPSTGNVFLTVRGKNEGTGRYLLCAYDVGIDDRLEFGASAGALRPLADAARGNPAPSLDPGGSTSGDGEAVTVRTFDFSSGLTVQADMAIPVLGAYYCDAWVGLKQSMVLGDGNHRAVGIRAETDHSHVSFWLNGQAVFDRPLPDTNYHRYAFRIRQDSRVEYFVDEALVHTSVDPVGPEYNNHALSVGGRSTWGAARVDNLLVKDGAGRTLFSCGFDSATPVDAFLVFGAAQGALQPSIDPSGGNLPPSLNPQGGVSGDGEGMTLATYDFTRGLIVESDVRISSLGGTACDGWIGLKPTTVVGDGEYKLVAIRAETAGSHVTCWLNGQLVHDRPLADTEFHKYWFFIRPDRLVEYFVDGTLVHTSTEQVDPQFTSRPVAVGGRSAGATAQIDNVRVVDGGGKLVFSNGFDTGPGTFAKSYGGPGAEVASCSARAAGGEFFLAGSTSSFGVSGFAAWISKVDGTGRVLWERAIDGPGADHFNGIVPASDGGCLAVGTSTSFGAGGYDGWAVRFDAAGAVVWQKAYGTSGWDEFQRGVATGDGGYLIAGAAPGYRGWIVKIDAAGELQWEKTYDATPGGTSCFSSLEPTSDGAYVASRLTGYHGGNWHGWVVKIDANGAVLWEKSIAGSAADESLPRVVATQDGGCVAVGDSRSGGLGGRDGWIVRLSSAGSIVWQKAIGGSLDDEFTCVQRTTDGGFLVGGTTASSGSGGTDAWLVKVDQDGAVLWQKVYGGGGADQFLSLLPGESDTWLATGRTGSFGEANGDFWFVKVNADGSVPPLGQSWAASVRTGTASAAGTASVVGRNAPSVHVVDNATVTATSATVRQQAP